MSPVEALDLAIVALNTCTDPEATTTQQWERLEVHADEAIIRLAALREGLS